MFNPLKRLEAYLHKRQQAKIDFAVKAGYGWAWAEFVLGGMSLDYLNAYAAGMETDDSISKAFDRGIHMALHDMVKQFGATYSVDLSQCIKPEEQINAESSKA